MVTNNPQQDQPESEFSSFSQDTQAELPLNTTETPVIEPETQEVNTTNTPVPADDIPAPTTEVPSPVTPPVTSDMSQVQQQLAEQDRKMAEMERERTVQALEKEALDMERRLTEQGLTESEARTQTMSHLQTKVNQIQLAEQQKQQRQVQEGKQNASIHYAKQYGLTIDDLADLQKATNEPEMKAIAENKSLIRKQAAEIEALKRGQVAPQQLDNNSPSPAVGQSSEDRLLDAYNEGVRTPEVVAAVARLQGR